MINFVVNSTKDHPKTKSTYVIGKKQTIVNNCGGKVMVITGSRLFIPLKVCLDGLHQLSPRLTSLFAFFRVSIRLVSVSFRHFRLLWPVIRKIHEDH